MGIVLHISVGISIFFLGSEISAVHLRLENKLDVILAPVQGAKDVTVALIFRIGSDHDPLGSSGMAHLMEHLAATSETRLAPPRDPHNKSSLRDYAATIAWTARRHTVLARTAPAAGLARELAGAAARVASLKTGGADLIRTRRGFAWESDLNTTLRPYAGWLVRDRVLPSPHGGRFGGSKEDIEGLSRGILKLRWDTYYKPVNFTLVVVGAIDVGTTSALARKLFGVIPEGERVPAPGRPGDVNPKLMVVFGKSRSSACAWRAPPFGSDAFPAFLMLAARLVDRSFAHGVHVVYNPLAGSPEILLVDEKTGDRSLAKQLALLSEFDGAPTPRDIESVSRRFGFALGLVSPPVDEVCRPPNRWGQLYGTHDLYALAYSLGRRQQLGIRSAALKKQLAEVDANALQRARAVFSAEHRAAVAVVPDLRAK